MRLKLLFKAQGPQYTRTKGSRLLGISNSEMVATEIQFLLTYILNHHLLTIINTVYTSTTQLTETLKKKKINQIYYLNLFTNKFT